MDSQAENAKAVRPNENPIAVVPSSQVSLDGPEKPPMMVFDGVAKPRGVSRAEAIQRAMAHESKGKMIAWLIGGCVVLCSWVYTLDNSTTYSYAPYATSQFNRHSMISTLSIATQIIAAVSRPFVSKISDVTSRPWAYALVLTLYTMGYIIVASSSTISAYIVGEVFVKIGQAGVVLLNTIIIGDLTPLKWRGLANAVCASPYIINVWFSGLIVQDILATNWRWGYGMFAIIMPVTISPAIVVLFILEHKAQKMNIPIDEPVVAIQKGEPWSKKIYHALIEIDAVGLILLGFGWSLLLLPFSLYQYAENGWKNPSMIAMMIVGGVLLIVHIVYEAKFAQFPSMPLRIVKNRTFQLTLVIEIAYMMSGNLRGLYLSSFAWITQDWTNQQWTYYNNTLTLTVCVFGIAAGFLMRYTHRYKWMQIIGTCIKIIGEGLMIGTDHQAKYGVQYLVWSQLLIGIGGGLSSVVCQVTAQAAVPHADLSIVISLLYLWTNIGYSIGAAISAPVWSSQMPKNLRTYLPANVTDTEVATFFADITAIRAYPYDSDIRQGAIEAYSRTYWYLIVASCAVTFVQLFGAIFQTNYYLGDQQNTVEDHEDNAHNEGPKGFLERITALLR